MTGSLRQTASMADATPPWFEVAAAIPLAATEWLGLGPFARHPRGDGALASLTPSSRSLPTAVDSSGTIGSQLLAVLSWYGGSVTAATLEAETPGADPDDLAWAIARLTAAGLVKAGPAGGLRLHPSLSSALEPSGVSFALPQAITSEGLGRILKALGITPAPTRKQDRIDAIAGLFAEPTGRARVVAGLSDRATALLEHIAERAGPEVVDTMAVGLDAYSLHHLEPSRFVYGNRAPIVPDEVAALRELTDHGIVGVAPWDGVMWIWREAWALLDRPLHGDWPSVPTPRTAPLADLGLRLPPLVGLADRALLFWDQNPPAVLKSGEPRLAKGVLRSTAKAIGTDEATVEIIATTVLSMGLLLTNVIGTSGRGRNKRTDEVWLADPDVRSAWSAAPAATRWLRLVAEWTNPRVPSSQQVVANRHLVLWELGALAPDEGWADDAEVARWLEHRYAPVGLEPAVLDTLADLRTLGLASTHGPLGLTEIGRLALTDPSAVERAEFAAADRAIVQADETVVGPPDLDADLVARLSLLATLESDAGARIFRLDEGLIIRAVQGGETAEDIVTFLTELSSVPLPDTVRTLVTDCARRAERVRIVTATTVVIADDPADLALACKTKAAKLTAVTDTVAVSTLPAGKLRPILDRKGLAPLLVTPTGDGVTPRRSSEDAGALERQAEQHRRFAERHGVDHVARYAEVLEAEAKAARDPGAKLVVRGPLAVTPLLLTREGT